MLHYTNFVVHLQYTAHSLARGNQATDKLESRLFYTVLCPLLCVVCFAQRRLLLLCGEVWHCIGRLHAELEQFLLFLSRLSFHQFYSLT